MISFEFATATRIIFGAGRSKDLGGIVAEFGKRALFVQPEPALPCATTALADGVAFGVSGEPPNLPALLLNVVGR